MTLKSFEIERTLVLHLDPDVLAQEGASYSCADEDRVKGRHYFICLGVDGPVGYWVPAFSNDAKGRHELAPSTRTGIQDWRDGTSYLDPTQVWTATHEAVIKAAKKGNDKSSLSCRNRAAGACIPNKPTTAPEPAKPAKPPGAPSAAASKPGGGTGAMPAPASE